MSFTIVCRKNVQGTKPIWYFYSGDKYLGALFLEETTDAELREIIEDGNWSGNVEYFDGPGFTQSSEAS